jgi:hypothetical protein
MTLVKLYMYGTYTYIFPLIMSISAKQFPRYDHLMVDKKCGHNSRPSGPYGRILHIYTKLLKSHIIYTS